MPPERSSANSRDHVRFSLQHKRSSSYLYRSKFTCRRLQLKWKARRTQEHCESIVFFPSHVFLLLSSNVGSSLLSSYKRYNPGICTGAVVLQAKTLIFINTHSFEAEMLKFEVSLMLRISSFITQDGKSFWPFAKFVPVSVHWAFDGDVTRKWWHFLCPLSWLPDRFLPFIYVENLKVHKRRYVVTWMKF